MAPRRMDPAAPCACARRDLRPLPLVEAWPPRPGRVTVTMSEGQWDGLLAAAYEQGMTLLELDNEERPVRAYRKAQGDEAEPS